MHSAETGYVSPASFVQRSMWASAQRYRGAPLNVLNLAWRVGGPLCLATLEAAVHDLVQRHPTLRARLAMHGGQLLQEVRAPEPVAVELAHFEHGLPQERLRAAEAWLADGGRRPLDPVTGPTLAVRLAKLAIDDHVLCFYVHHAMCDGWSGQVIVRDLAKFYGARARGNRLEPPPLSIQYADTVQGQQKTYESGGYSEEIGYWKEELAEPGPPLLLPAPRPRKANRDFMANSPVLQEPPDALARLRESARRMKVSPFTVLLASLAVLLRHRTGLGDLLVGVPILNRWSPAEMEFVGCATNLLPARIRVSDSQRLDELCAQVHATVRRLLAYGRVPLEVILRETQASPFGGSLLPVWCQLREAPPRLVDEGEGLTFETALIERGALLAELDVDALAGPGGLVTEFSYRPSLFDREWIDAFMGDFSALLRGVSIDTTSTVAKVCSSLDTGTKETV